MMTEDTAPATPTAAIPSDVALLLRADAEQRWLHREVIPVLRQLERSDPLPGEQVTAALAYLEDSWNEALLRARHTDAAGERGSRGREYGGLGEDAVRYHTAVRALRGIVAERIGAYVPDAAPDEPECVRIA